MNPNRFCVYRHIRPDKDEPFYIGIGDYKRPYNFVTGRNRYWKSVFNINKGNIIVEIMLDELSWEKACESETWWISFYGRSDESKGPLVNMTSGGEGAYGRKKTVESINKYKQTMLEKGINPKIGYKHTAEAIKKISEAGKRKKSPEEIEKCRIGNIGKKRSPETMKKLREIWNNRPPLSEETKRKLSEIRKGKSVREDVKSKISKTLKGHYVSESTKKLMSENSTVKRKVINIITGTVYSSIRDACKSQDKYKLVAFRRRLTGTIKDISFNYKYYN